MAKPIHITTLAEMNNDQLRPYVDAFTVTNTGSGTDDTDYLIPFELFLVGTRSFFTGVALGDYISVKVIDIDNVLGLGANTILSTPVAKYYMPPLDNSYHEFNMGYPLYAPNGVYVRVSYSSSNILSNVTGKVNLFTHKII